MDLPIPSATWHGGGTHSEGTLVAVPENFSITLKQHDDAWWFHAQIVDGRRDALVHLVATSIVRRQLEPSPAAFASWTARHDGGPAHDGPTKAVFEEYLRDFARTSNKARLQGAVVEHLWACLAEDLDGGWGTPIHVEHDHFSVLDHGGDGLSLYESEGSVLRFRLWESKQHDSKKRSVTEAVRGASGQLKANAAGYLARLSKPLQLNDDERIRQLAGRIVKLWTTRDRAGGVGVSVGTAATALPSRPFRGLRKAFPDLETPEHREGLVIEVPNLGKFAKAVRAEILKGIE